MHSFKREAVMLLAATLVLAGCGGDSNEDSNTGDAGNAVPPPNVAISTAADMQLFPQITSDGAGGAIIAWQDLRSGSDDIYAQRVDSGTVPQWTADGVAISTAASDQFALQILADGAGGAIVVWMDSRSGTSYDIYAQRVDSAGVPQWAPDGIAISTAASHQVSPQLVTDGAGGAIIAWSDIRSGNADIYAQRVNGAGTVQWAVDGVAISTAANHQANPQLVADGAGGAIIAWEDSRSGNADIYAQRVNGAGAVQWAVDGVAIGTAANDQANPRLVADGAGGAIIVWQDLRSGTPSLYAQRVDGAGFRKWFHNGINGRAVGTQGTVQFQQIVADGAGGAIVVWQENRSGTPGIYAQRFDGAGNSRWSPNSVAVGTLATAQSPQIVTDGAGGAIIVWDESRGGSGNIYAQRVGSTGAAQWTANGVAVSAAGGSWQKLVTDGAGGAIIVWQEVRNGGFDIYAQRVRASGSLQ